VLQVSILQDNDTKIPFGGFGGYMVMRSGGILNAKKDPPVQNLGLFGKKIDESLALQDQDKAQGARKV
jgi:hypothetical protein